MDNYNKIWSVIRKTDLLNYEEKNELHLYLMGLKKQQEIIDKAKSLNYEISHTIYEKLLEENIIGGKFLYERVKKQLAILEDKEETDTNVGEV